MTAITLNTVWSYAQRLSDIEKDVLCERLRETITETKEQKRQRAASAIDSFFGGWSDDSRSSEEIYADIRSARTINSAVL